MNYTIKIDLEEEEIKAIRTLADTYNRCMMDERIQCEDCPFNNVEVCLPFSANMFNLKEATK